ncbi:hypothetical protein BDR06DRAFT_960371 [Suillus hirtellus]|nr:hypothetical protein BDR06DRAFT_960371 [Suillus hirtellus]
MWFERKPKEANRMRCPDVGRVPDNMSDELCFIFVPYLPAIKSSAHRREHLSS